MPNGEEEARDKQISSESGDEDSISTMTIEDLIDNEYWTAKGKVAGRMAEMFDSFRPILEQGMFRKPGVDESALHTTL